MSENSGARPSLMPASLGSKVTLHLGVIDHLYRTPGGTSRRKKPRRISARTTFEVAKILEAKYGLYSAYIRVHEADISRAIEESLQGALEKLMQGEAVGDPWRLGGTTHRGWVQNVHRVSRGGAGRHPGHANESRDAMGSIIAALTPIAQ